MIHAIHQLQKRSAYARECRRAGGEQTTFPLAIKRLVKEVGPRIILHSCCQCLKHRAENDQISVKHWYDLPGGRRNYCSRGQYTGLPDGRRQCNLKDNCRCRTRKLRLHLLDARLEIDDLHLKNCRIGCCWANRAGWKSVNCISCYRKDPRMLRLYGTYLIPISVRVTLQVEHERASEICSTV